MSAIQTIQIVSISTALIASGGIATISAFDTPLIRSQPASRSLPMIRWLFSRGSHTFPTAALISSPGFAYLAYNALPPSRTLTSLLSHATKGIPGLYLAASLLTLSIAPFTSLVMIPTNFALIARNEALGGSRSANSAQHRSSSHSAMSAEESVDGKDDISQWTDHSDAQEKTSTDSTRQQDEEVRNLLDEFQALNTVRAVLMGAGGVVGLIGALA